MEVNVDGNPQKIKVSRNRSGTGGTGWEGALHHDSAGTYHHLMGTRLGV